VSGRAGDPPPIIAGVFDRFVLKIFFIANVDTR
jgi:hypothetical protein